MNLKTTLKEIKSHAPCEDGWKKLLKNLKTTDLDTEVTLLQILESNGIKDAFWALRCWDYESYCLLLANVAESVLPIFEKRNPKDSRPRKAIDTIILFKRGKATKQDLRNAATDAYAAATDADAAANTATYAAAYDAAYDADTAAATYADANAAAYAAAAADAAADAADAAAYADAYADATREKQWQKNESLMREFING